jgi:hypothetical protein
LVRSSRIRIGVLLEHGADLSAIDDKGRTPLDWLDRAAKSVDRERIRSLLRRRPDRQRSRSP